MQTPVPPSVKWIQYLLKFQLIMMACMLVLIGGVLYVEPEEGILKGFVDVFLKHHGIDESERSIEYVIPYFIGLKLIPSLAIIFEYDFLIRKKQIGFWICFAIDLVFTMASHGIPVLSAFVFVLAVLKPTRHYFSQGKNKKTSNILDDDILS